MATKLDLPGISRFDPDVEHSSVGPRCQAWREELNYYIATAILQMISRKETYFFILQDLKSRKFFQNIA